MSERLAATQRHSLDGLAPLAATPLANSAVATQRGLGSRLKLRLESEFTIVGEADGPT